MHQWSNDDCKTLLTAIRLEKRNRESKTSFVCSYCRVLFKTFKHLVQHKKICASQPHLMPNHEPDGMEDLFMDEMIVEGEEIVGMENFQLEHIPQNEKQSTSSGRSSSYDINVPPHRQNTRQAQPLHMLDEMVPEDDKPMKYNSSSPPPVMTPMAPKYNSAMTNRHRGSHLKCPECLIGIESLEDFLNHCKERHETPERKFIVEKRLFDTRDEFKKWFDQRQEDTCTSLTKRTGHGGETLYRCHRVGKYRSVAKSRKSNPRKIDQTCTAYLKVNLDEDGSLWATGCFTHIGHELDHKLLWLTETQEAYVRELIDLGWNSDQIFYFIRNEYKDYDCKLKYISKNDIRNITVRYNREKEKMGFLAEEKPKNAESNPGEEEAAAENTEQKEPVGNQEDLKIEEEDEDDDVIKTKVPRVEGEEFDSKVDQVEAVDSSEQVEQSTEVKEPKPLEDSSDKPPALEPPSVAFPEEEEGDEVVPESVDEEEEEIINVVDDDSMPELQKIDG
ncbi:hypothetical protein CAEBREN_10683 [Caenorhabditis brenneri]|uniref:C2H2-type domain-containing protein n=1 Tax=Caenorhabditis brenneri TaxID=135651 RepID=G0N6P6_CAEBE|nr:hypothetical protein CAEBREN_10683 [Caenorhabditis brenneri]